MNGKEFFLVDVIAHILHHLKWRLLEVLRDFGYKELKASDINWVITVPAIWKSKGKKMMREAGYMVSPNLNTNAILFNQMLQLLFFSLLMFVWLLLVFNGGIYSFVPLCVGGSKALVC